MQQSIRRCRSDWDLAQCGQYRNGLYYSRWYRGLGAGMEWLRLSLNTTGPVLVRVYTTDEMPTELPDGLEPVLERQASDLLLYGIKGLFLCFTVEPGEALRSYELTFPGLSIDSLLPAVMQGDETMRKLLGIYQSLYMDLNQELARFPDRMDPENPDYLPELCRWLGAASWMGEGLPERELLAHAVELNRLRGTKKGIKLLVKLVTGQPCEIVEQFQWDRHNCPAQEREDCARLYGSDLGKTAILLPAGTSMEALSRFQAVLEDFIPLGVPYTVIRLEKDASLDGYSCLDGGMQISEPLPGILDGPEEGEWILE